jgi:peptidyl-dipeptidase Dcp
VSGALELCERIFDVSISINITAHKSHEDALNYDVFDKNGQKLATLTFDLFHRPGKENTSHCYSLLSPCTMHGKRVPVPVFMSFNFSKTPESKYTRLNFDDVTTILHELGHAFQVIFNQNPVETPFPSVSGLAPVDEDLDEVVSQLMENFAYEESFLDRIGFDYESGNKIPDQVKKILSVKRKIFAGTNLMYCLMTSYLDLEIHNRNPANLDIPTFERQTLKRIFKKLADNKEPELHNLPHIVTHSLGAGYYRYLQASVYETDIYEMFNDKALGDEEKRTKLLRFLRESSLCPDKAFKNLRGRAVDSNAFIRNYGLKGLFNIIQASKSVNLTDNISQPMPILT